MSKHLTIVGVPVEVPNAYENYPQEVKDGFRACVIRLAERCDGRLSSVTLIRTKQTRPHGPLFIWSYSTEPKGQP